MAPLLAAMEESIVSTVVPRITSDLAGFEQVSRVYAIYMFATAVSLNMFTGTFSQTLGAAVLGMLFNLVTVAAGAERNLAGPRRKKGKANKQMEFS